MNNPFSIEAAFPPSLAGQPLLAMTTVMAFWAVTLICLQWIYETVSAAGDAPAPKRSYIRIARGVRLWLAVTAFLLTAPRLAQLMLWQVMDKDQREWLAVANWVACVPAAGTIIYAWWSHRTMVKTEEHYIETQGYYAAAPSTRAEKTRGFVIILLVFVVAFATTFVRPSPNVDAPRSSLSRGS